MQPSRSSQALFSTHGKRRQQLELYLVHQPQPQRHRRGLAVLGSESQPVWMQTSEIMSLRYMSWVGAGAAGRGSCMLFCRRPEVVSPRGMEYRAWGWGGR